MFSASKHPRRLRRFTASEDGTITVEFVIWAPLIIYIGVALFTLSFYIATISEVQQTAHDVARSSIGLVNGGTLEGDLCETMGAEVLPRVAHGMAIIDVSRFEPMGSCPQQPDPHRFVTIQLTYNLSGTGLHSLGKMFGLDFGPITRFSVIQL